MKKGFSGNGLKIIALITMLIDHVGSVIVERAMLLSGDDYVMYERLYTVDMLLRSIGRIAFPVYCFLLVEGFLHTKNVLKYMLRLLLFALVSEVPFNLAMTGKLINPYYQNIFFTLLIGLLVISGMDYLWKWKKQNKIFKMGFCVVLVCLGALISEVLCTDYGAKGVLPIAALYLFRFNRLNQAIVGVLSFSWEFPAPLAFLPVLSYNGERGKGNKYWFYVFYPLHLMILYFISVCFGLA